MEFSDLLMRSAMGTFEDALHTVKKCALTIAGGAGTLLVNSLPSIIGLTELDSTA